MQNTRLRCQKNIHLTSPSRLRQLHDRRTSDKAIKSFGLSDFLSASDIMNDQCYQQLRNALAEKRCHRSLNNFESRLV